jgi:long-chain fatty acid transport protein
MKLKKIAALIAIAGLSTSAFATNGYFSHGYGMKAKGMGGVGIALPQDALAAATNPAGITEIGDRLDVGLDIFMPRRGAQVAGTEYSGDGKKTFYVPELGYNKKLGWDMAAGIAIYGNGGMNSVYNDYNAGAGANAFGTGVAGVDLVQMFIAPTFAMKLNKNHTIGVSLVYGYQQFGASGLNGFGPASSASGSLTNNGHDDSDGWGLRLGWTGKITDNVTLGATYASKMNMSKFDKYKGLFAEQGDFDIPENYGIGIAVKATPQLTIAADIQQINYSKVKSIANKLDMSCMPGFGTGTCPLGADNGAGFGWRDMTVYKLGASYEYSKALTLRAGVSTARQPIPASETYFNILAPGVIENHLTLGATWTMANKSELTVGYMHGFKKTVTGVGDGTNGATGKNIHMYQNSLGIGYGIKFD